MSIQIPRGTQDILPGEVEKWQYIEKKAREICEKFQYKKFERRFLNIQNFLHVVLGKQQISCKKKCIHLKIVADVV